MENNKKIIKFDGKLLVLGCGSVSQCTLPLLLELIDIPAKNITVIDFVDQRKKIVSVLNAGVIYRQERISEKNFKEIICSYLEKGDLLVDLTWNLDTLELVNFCHHQGICYLNTSVEVWNPFINHSTAKPAELTLYHRQMKLNEMVKGWNGVRGPTAMVDHGANPGLVSHFLKQGLLDIATHLRKEKPTDPRLAAIDTAIDHRDYARLSYLLGVKTVHISERDTQITSEPKKINEFVNTWSVEGLIEEGLSPAEMGWGTHERSLPPGAVQHEAGPKNQICLNNKGINTWVQSWVPSGNITGMVIRHGEAYSISERYTVIEKGQVLYRPTVHYAYCPSDSTINSLHELEMRGYVPQSNQRILSDEIIDGHDELGCLIMGHDFKAWWIGSVLDIHAARQLVPGQNATTIQVAIGVIAALVYIIRNPGLGFCLPDDFPHDEILSIAKPYLGQFLSVPVNWTPLKQASAFANFGDTLPKEEDCWQMTSFLLSPKASGDNNLANIDSEINKTSSDLLSITS